MSMRCWQIAKVISRKLELWRNINQGIYEIFHPYDICWTFGKATDCKTRHDIMTATIYQNVVEMIK